MAKNNLTHRQRAQSRCLSAADELAASMSAAIDSSVNNKNPWAKLLIGKAKGLRFEKMARHKSEVD